VASCGSLQVNLILSPIVKQMAQLCKEIFVNFEEILRGQGVQFWESGFYFSHYQYQVIHMRMVKILERSSLLGKKVKLFSIGEYSPTGGGLGNIPQSTSHIC